MCYDISFTVNIPQLSDYFPDLVFDEQLQLSFESFDHAQGVSVYGQHPIIYEPTEDHRLHCRLMEWGVMEYYLKEEPDWKKRNGMLNIRSERVLDDFNSYWYKIRNRRCLIPVTGIYEHRGILGWKKKVPYFIKPKGAVSFFLPGLYSVVELPDKATGEMIRRYSFGMITTAANEIMRQIHNSGDNPFRMPLFLPLEMGREFVSKSLSPERYREILQYSIPSEGLEYFPVHTIRTAKPRPDGLCKYEPFEWPNLPPLGTMDPEPMEK